MKQARLVPSGKSQKSSSHPDRLLVGEEITLRDILSLCSGEILALRIPGFLSEVQCAELSGRIRRKASPGRYSMAGDLDVFRTGMTLFETQFDSQKNDEYFATVFQNHEIMKMCCSPLENPNDLVQKELNSLWPAGAMNEELGGKSLGFGTCRIFLNGQRLPPHIDYLPKDVKDYPRELYPECQLAANVYISNPEEGGELNCWEGPVDLDELHTIQSGVYDFIKDEVLSEPDVTIRPQTGDLIFIRASDIHSVNPSKGGARMAFSFFINYRGKNKPLRYYV